MSQDTRSIILELEDRRLSAMLAADVFTLEEITSDRYVHIESTGKRRDKAEFLKGLESGEYRFESFEIGANDVTVSSGMAYVCGSYCNVIRTRTGINPPKRARHVRIYECEDGVWRNTYHQATEFG